MEFDWLGDFVVLVECRSFSRAASRRHVTQPAFSRRIRALESWIGAPLIDRHLHGVVLTAAGEAFLPCAEDLLRRLQVGRDEALGAARTASEVLRFACTHTLAASYFPNYLRQVEAHAPVGAVLRLFADSTLACERLMLQGQMQLLLCHRHPAKPSLLAEPDFRSVSLDCDVMLPVSAPAAAGGPRHRVPEGGAPPAPYLAYAPEAGLGQIVAHMLALHGPPPRLEPAFTSHQAAILVAMARAGRGIAWAPRTLVAEDLASGRLVRAGTGEWDIPLDICLVRPCARQTLAVESLWTLLTANRAAGAATG
ncbi:MAG TPA: LysR family transcriptional regulator [Roseomonas sp.]